MLEVTKAAEAVIAELMSNAGEDVVGLRIAVVSGGCAGLQYRMGLETQVLPDDEVMESGDARLLIDALSRPLLNGAQVDFRQDGPEPGFVFENPNAASMCSSCGKTSCG